MIKIKSRISVRHRVMSGLVFHHLQQQQQKLLPSSIIDRTMICCVAFLFLISFSCQMSFRCQCCRKSGFKTERGLLVHQQRSHKGEDLSKFLTVTTKHVVVTVDENGDEILDSNTAHDGDNGFDGFGFHDNEEGAGDSGTNEGGMNQNSYCSSVDNGDEIDHSEIFSVNDDESFSVPHTFDKRTAALAPLIKIFHDAGASEKMFNDVVDEFQNLLRSDTVNKNNKVPAYHTIITNLHSSFKIPPPVYKTVEIDLPESCDDGKKRTVQVPTFDFRKSLQDLLDSCVFEDEDNIDVDNGNPFASGYRPKHEKESTNSSGSESEGSNDDEEQRNDVERKYRFELIEPPSLQEGGRYQASLRVHVEDKKDDALTKWFSFGIVLFIDKISSNDKMQVYGMEPLMMSLTCMTEEQRRKPENWRCLGYIPKLPKKSIKVGEKDVRIPSSFHLLNYHKVLDVLLEGLVKCQHSNPAFRMRVGNQYKWARAHIHVNNMIADGLAIDQVCCRYVWHGKCPRICVACHTFQEEANQTGNLDCRFLTQWGIEKMIVAALGPTELDGGGQTEFNVALSKLSFGGKPTKVDQQMRALDLRKKIVKEILHKVFAQHTVDNAFFKVEWYDNPCGIFSARGADILHCLEEGLFSHLMIALLKPFTQSQCNELDRIAEELINQSRAAMRNLYPEVNLSKGFTNLTTLSADRRVGRLFLLMLIMETPAGQRLFEERCDASFDARKAKRSGNQKKKDTEASEDKDKEESCCDNESVTADNGGAVENAVVEDDQSYHTLQEEDQDVDEDSYVDDIDETGIHIDGSIDMDGDNDDDEYNYLIYPETKEFYMNEDTYGEYDDHAIDDESVVEIRNEIHERMNLVHLVLKEALGLEFLIGFIHAMDVEHRCLCYNIIWAKIWRKVKRREKCCKETEEVVARDYIYNGLILHTDLHRYADKRQVLFSTPPKHLQGCSSDINDNIHVMESPLLSSISTDLLPKYKVKKEDMYNTLYDDSVYSEGGHACGLDRVYRNQPKMEDHVILRLDNDIDSDSDNESDDNIEYELKFEYKRQRWAQHSFDGSIHHLRVLCWRLLALHSLLNYNGIDLDDKTSLRLLMFRIDECINSLNECVKRGDKTLGWALQKLHDLRHIVLEWIRFGHSDNVNAGKCESGLKSWGKGPAKNARKRGNELFTKSAARKYHNRCLIEKVAYVVGKPPVVADVVMKDSVHLFGRCIVFSQDDWWLDNTQRVSPDDNNDLVDNDVLIFLRKEFKETNEIKLYPEAKLLPLHGDVPINVRGAPYYNKDSKEWYDWVDVNWETYDAPFPFQIRGFFRHPDSEQPCAVGYCAIEQTHVEKLKSRGLVEHWRVEDGFRWIPCASIMQVRFGFFLTDKLICEQDKVRKRQRRQAIVVKERNECWGSLFMSGWDVQDIAKGKVQNIAKGNKRKR